MALTTVEGRWERDGNHQKKAMKTKSTKSQSAPGLRVQSSNHQETPAPVSAPAGAATPEQTPERPPLPRIDFARRQANRELPTDQLLALLRSESPRFYELAEVVGKWVWIQFAEKQPREVTATLAQLGFHWNNTRQTWQHPCGALTQGSPGEVRNASQHVRVAAAQGKAGLVTHTATSCAKAASSPSSVGRF